MLNTRNSTYAQFKLKPDGSFKTEILEYCNLKNKLFIIKSGICWPKRTFKIHTITGIKYKLVYKIKKKILKYLDVHEMKLTIKICIKLLYRCLTIPIKCR